MNCCEQMSKCWRLSWFSQNPDISEETSKNLHSLCCLPIVTRNIDMILANGSMDSQARRPTPVQPALLICYFHIKPDPRDKNKIALSPFSMEYELQLLNSHYRRDERLLFGKLRRHMYAFKQHKDISSEKSEVRERRKKRWERDPTASLEIHSFKNK